jgi:hypothetical protein
LRLACSLPPLDLKRIAIAKNASALLKTTAAATQNRDAAVPKIANAAEAAASAAAAKAFEFIGPGDRPGPLLDVKSEKCGRNYKWCCH